MGYNMYDKDYGSGFTPENDNRPPEERPGYKPPEQTEQTEQAQAAPAAQPAGSTQQAEATQTSQSEQTAQPTQTAAQQSVVNGEYHYSYGFQQADSSDFAGAGSTQPTSANAYGSGYHTYNTGNGYQTGNAYGGTYGASANADYGNGTTPPTNPDNGGRTSTPPPKPPRKPKKSGGSG
ncbi:MAG: hypothetical protein LIO51_01930, partial [Clostridiales bacterium]|nr:hypothetical protein [Clostridiales bacterium]